MLKLLEGSDNTGLGGGARRLLPGGGGALAPALKELVSLTNLATYVSKFHRFSAPYGG